MTIWFTADTHFGHERIIRLCHRPFESVAEMDAKLIENWNSVVRWQDTVWHLGDFSWRNSAASYRHRLHGKIEVLVGNHDNDRELIEVFGADHVHHVAELRYHGETFWLSHYAHRVWPRSHHGAFHLYGHSHGTLPGHFRSMDVGVDAQQFTPVHIDQVIKQLAPFDPHDHHPEMRNDPVPR